MNWDKINAEMERNRALLIGSVVSSALSTDPKHSHFWVEDGELYESYQTIRGMRYRHRFSVAGLPDTDQCSEAMILYISKEYLD